MRKLTVFISLAAGILTAANAAGKKSPTTAPFDFSTYFIGDAQPAKVEVVGNPLDYAAARIGLDVRGVELPRAYENSYRFACRFPIIDYVSNRPLYMKQWAEDNAARITRAHATRGIGGAVRAGLEMLRGTDRYPALSLVSNQTAVAGVRRALGRSNFTTRYQNIVLALYERFADAKILTRQVRTNLTQDDLDFFNANPAYFLCPDGKRMVDLTGTIDSQFQFVEHARRVGYEYLFQAAQVLTSAIEDYVARTKNFQVQDFYIDTTKTQSTFELHVGDDTLVISGFGNDTHTRDANFLIDLDGDDIYSNNAGGCDSVADGIALCIDHAGNDQYLAPDRQFVQGFGFLGVGMLVDLAGDDKYTARHFSQGAGIMGVGALWDLGGSDTYDAHAFCQGAGMFGIGMLLDDSGDDLYDCATLGQGAATTLGIGILSDLAGDDRYQLALTTSKDALGQAPGYGQGGALSFRQFPWEGKLTNYGGVGMLVDHAGNDSYRTNGWCDQGGSYIMSLGVLVDDAGNDRYSAGTGQGSGIHITNAILIDKQGDDVYEGGFRSGGSGGDRSPGFLIDYQGNDTYKSKTSSYGTGCKPFCFSLFIDYQGSDSYVCPEPREKITFNNWDSFGGVWPESDPSLWPFAICLDLGGNDDYQVRGRQNNAERSSFGHGIFLDTEWKGSRPLRADVIGTIENPLEPYHDFPLPEAVKKSNYYDDIRQLQNPDNFIRFQAVGKITRDSVDIVPVLVEALMASSHRQFNRDLLECIHYFFSRGAFTEKEIPALIKLLKAPDVEVRTIIADNFRIWKLASAETGLLAALNDSAAPVRRFALAALARSKTTSILPVVQTLAVPDPSEDVRRAAVRFLTRVRDEVDPFPLLAQILASDPSSSVRVAAADGIGYLQDPKGIEPLRSAAKTGDVYLQRAAGKALADLGQVDGIEILIRSLSFPSIDAFYNYDLNVPNFIAAYAGFDLPDPQRYEQAEWQQWFDDNKNKIDLKNNVRAFRELSALTETLRGTAPAEQIQKYEAFLKQYPLHQRARKILAGILNEVAWKQVTAVKGSANYDPKNGLRYARRAVELDPEAGYYDTLAQAFEANAQINEAIALCREMLEKFPNERMFEERLLRLEKK
jgi:hypothetical protein